MKGAPASTGWALRTARNPSFWIVVAMLAICGLFHYGSHIRIIGMLSGQLPLGLTRHTMERVLFLLPITYAGFVFGPIRGFFVLSVAASIMFPRALLISPVPADAVVETTAVLVTGGLIILWFQSLEREKARRAQVIARLEVAQRELQSHVSEEKRMQDNLRFYLRQTTRAQEEERKRIARELHDDTIQELVGLSRQLDTLRGGSEQLPEHAIKRVDELQNRIDDIIRGVRRFSQDLRPSVLDDLGLVAALESIADDLTERYGIPTKVEVAGEHQRLPSENELLLFRIAQEALRNVWRHSQASRASISVAFGHDKIKIAVQDNGKGFQLPARVDSLAGAGKLGLAGMHERAGLLGGTLEVRSEPGKGTTVVVEVPAPSRG